jgi:hypothetical protein
VLEPAVEMLLSARRVVYQRVPFCRSQTRLGDTSDRGPSRANVRRG